MHKNKNNNLRLIKPLEVLSFLRSISPQRSNHNHNHHKSMGFSESGWLQRLEVLLRKRLLRPPPLLKLTIIVLVQIPVKLVPVLLRPRRRRKNPCGGSYDAKGTTATRRTVPTTGRRVCWIPSCITRYCPSQIYPPRIRLKLSNPWHGLSNCWNSKPFSSQEHNRHPH